MRKKIKITISLSIAILFAILILIFSTLKTKAIEIGPVSLINSGTFAHLTAYFILSCSLVIYFKELEKGFATDYKKFISGLFDMRMQNREKILLKAAIIAGSYGIIIEIIQALIPYRCFQPTDMLINFTGAFLVFIAYPILKKIN